MFAQISIISPRRARGHAAIKMLQHLRPGAQLCQISRVETSYAKFPHKIKTIYDTLLCSPCASKYFLAVFDPLK
jgi:hypothetical protein